MSPWGIAAAIGTVVALLVGARAATIHADAAPHREAMREMKRSAK